MTKLKLLAVVAVAVFLAVLVPAAHADSVTNLDFSASNGTGPFGTVTLHVIDADTVKVTVDLGTNVFAVTGAGAGALGFDVDKTYSLVAATLTTGFTLEPVTASPGSYGFASGIGDFTSDVECTVCGNGTSTPNRSTFSMELTNPGGLTPSDFVSNGSFLFASDIGASCVGQEGCPSSGFNTFPAGDDGKTPPVNSPEPSTSMLLGFGLLGLVGLRRKQIFG
jgi:hypothetical protein